MFTRLYFSISTIPLMGILLLSLMLNESLRKEAKNIWFDKESNRIPFLNK